ncbi:MAG: hypothetical protein OEO79_16645 [Gemmatimonadota bacterium]|nr:hypothetical protein [Gemmatimonadota bacterium]
MNDERRYDEDEAARIFEIATEARESGPRTMDVGTGMTLRELQEIGEEIGISREVVARAASSIDAVSERGGVTRVVGMPTGVHRVVDLPRSLTDLEWERLVALLRRTFNAKGKVEGHGSLRVWTNSNLQAHVEPTETGYQLRLQTHKGSLGPMLLASTGFLVMAVVSAIGELSAGLDDLMGATVLAAIGLGVAASTLLRLPSWSKLRAEQMDEIADAVGAWTALPPGDE